MPHKSSSHALTMTFSSASLLTIVKNWILSVRDFPSYAMISLAIYFLYDGKTLKIQQRDSHTIWERNVWEKSLKISHLRKMGGVNSMETRGESSPPSQLEIFTRQANKKYFESLLRQLYSPTHSSHPAGLAWWWTITDRWLIIDESCDWYSEIRNHSRYEVTMGCAREDWWNV